MIWPSISVLFLAALLPTLSWAQQPVHSLPELETRVFLGDAVRVIDINEQAIDGRLQRISADSLALVVDGGLRELSEVNIREIRKRSPDRWWNGALIGAGIGVGTGVATAAAVCEGGAECTAWGTALLAPGLAGMGAGIGALIDFAISKFDTVYVRPETSVSFDFLPILSRESKGIQCSISF